MYEAGSLSKQQARIACAHSFTYTNCISCARYSLKHYNSINSSIIVEHMATSRVELRLAWHIPAPRKSEVKWSFTAATRARKGCLDQQPSTESSYNIKAPHTTIPIVRCIALYCLFVCFDVLAHIEEPLRHIQYYYKCSNNTVLLHCFTITITIIMLGCLFYRVLFLGTVQYSINSTARHIQHFVVLQ